jgi:hypothetical protein
LARVPACLHGQIAGGVVLLAKGQLPRTQPSPSLIWIMADTL